MNHFPTGIAERLAAIFTPRFALPPRAVSHNSELDRILSLPRRTWDENDPRIIELTFAMSVWLRLPGSTATLRPIQAIALCELYYYHCIFGALYVGAGKTLLAFLAAVVLGSQRPILFVPAKLRDVKTPREFAKLAKDWRSPPSMRIVSYEQLSRDYGDETRIGPHGAPMGILDLADPDLIIDDEANKLKNRSTACARKMEFFMERHPNVPHVDLSGTMTEEQIQDFAHILGWTHKNNAPVPNSNTSYRTLCDWGNALNVKVKDEDRVQVGALLELATEEERRTLDPTSAARRGFRRRLLETPGVIAHATQYMGTSLIIEEAEEPNYSISTEAHFNTLRTTGVLPNGYTTSGGLENWRHEREMARGFFYYFDPPPPMPWRVARQEWHSSVRKCLTEGQDGHSRIDSEWQVANACARPQKRHDNSEVWAEARRAYAAWIAIRDEYIPNDHKVTGWIADAPWLKVANWMANNKGLVWVEHIEFAERLSRETGARYFHEGGLDASGMTVEDARPDRDGSIILSIESNRDGRNLQDHWSANYFTVPPKGANACEQALGRTHRPGQMAEEVTAEMALWCRADGEAWHKILSKSRYIVDTSGLPAKVLYADVIMPTEKDLADRAVRSARFC